MATTTDPKPAVEDGERRGRGMGLAQKVAVNSASQAASQLFAALAGILSVGIAARYLSVN